VYVNGVKAKKTLGSYLVSKPSVYRRMGVGRNKKCRNDYRKSLFGRVTLHLIVSCD
jgi:hypothetical protein